MITLFLTSTHFIPYLPQYIPYTAYQLRQSRNSLSQGTAPATPGNSRNYNTIRKIWYMVGFRKFRILQLWEDCRNLFESIRQTRVFQIDWHGFPSYGILFTACKVFCFLQLHLYISVFLLYLCIFPQSTGSGKLYSLRERKWLWTEQPITIRQISRIL